MGNQLFQQARQFVENVLHSDQKEEQAKKSEIAKNALSSAFANSTEAEKKQLRELQEELEDSFK